MFNWEKFLKKKDLFVGIDPSASPRRASGICMMNSNLRILNIGKWYEFSDLDKIISPYKDQIRFIAIDGPLQPPHELDWCCFSSRSPACSHHQTTSYKGRYCEFLLIKKGFRCFVTSKNSFAKDWMLHCFQLNSFLGEIGYRTLEVFPTATRKILFPALKGKKQLKPYREKLQHDLIEWGIQFPDTSVIYSDDELDAVLASLTALLHYRRKTIPIGNSADGFIFIPDI